MRGLSEQTTTLVGQELDLAKLELTEKGKRAGIGVGMFGGPGALGLYSAGALTACFILALATAVRGWLAALIVAAVYGAVAEDRRLRSQLADGAGSLTEAIRSLKSPPRPKRYPVRGASVLAAAAGAIRLTWQKRPSRTADTNP
jgi:hypothetical protein